MRNTQKGSPFTAHEACTLLRGAECVQPYLFLPIIEGHPMFKLKVGERQHG